MNTIPPELTAPIEFLKKFKLGSLSSTTFHGVKEIALNFEIVSSSSIYRPMAEKIIPVIAEIISELDEKRKSQFTFPKVRTIIEVEDGPLMEIYNEETFEFETIPDFHVQERKKPFDENDKIELWNNYIEMVNRYKKICNGFGYTFDIGVPVEVVKSLIYFQIEDTFLIEHASRENFSDVLQGNKSRDKWSTQKILITLNKGEAAYFFERIKNSGKLPIINEMIKAGAFYWKGEELTWEKMSKEKSKFKKSEKKAEIQSYIDAKVDEILAMI